jgi:AraC-like DNA-binding protein
VFRPGLVRRETGAPERRTLRSGDPGEILCRRVGPRQAEALGEVYSGALGDSGDLEFTNAALAYALVASWTAYRLASEPAPLNDVHPAVAKAARLLSESDETISLEELAPRAGLSAARLSRLFKQQTGISVTGFRQRQCLERFLRLYRTGARYSLIEAALLAGFGSYPQFHRVFTRMMGTGPAACRRRIGVSAERKPIR